MKEITYLVEIFVYAWLSIYLIMSLTILFSRFFTIKSWISKEQFSLESLLMGAKIQAGESILKNFMQNSPGSKNSEERLQVGLSLAAKKSTSGLTWLGIMAATSPFIGLFGTVISILAAFADLSADSSIAQIAPKISGALTATAAGIFVAIPAYSFHLVLKRKSFELLNVLEQEINIILSMQKDED